MSQTVDNCEVNEKETEMKMNASTTIKRYPAGYIGKMKIRTILAMIASGALKEYGENRGHAAPNMDIVNKVAASFNPNSIGMLVFDDSPEHTMCDWHNRLKGIFKRYQLYLDGVISEAEWKKTLNTWVPFKVISSDEFMDTHVSINNCRSHTHMNKVGNTDFAQGSAVSRVIKASGIETEFALHGRYYGKKVQLSYAVHLPDKKDLPYWKATLRKKEVTSLANIEKGKEPRYDDISEATVQKIADGVKFFEEFRKEVLELGGGKSDIFYLWRATFFGFILFDYLGKKEVVDRTAYKLAELCVNRISRLKELLQTVNEDNHNKMVTLINGRANQRL